MPAHWVQAFADSGPARCYSLMLALPRRSRRYRNAGPSPDQWPAVLTASGGGLRCAIADGARPGAPLEEVDPVGQGEASAGAGLLLVQDRQGKGAGRFVIGGAWRPCALAHGWSRQVIRLILASPRSLF
ncbi:protein of unknown function [Denitratisoma oestradiolicum]|uniref:Uncharacterized protein n=1 Tax=Denitratisoma oestradiolicum TaxID=311182 RepID=A0A6S6XXF9_9PROT|nr:protein of unknown function [Denitratisoma oestradiolicum]